MLLSTFGIAPQAKVTNPLKDSFVTAVPSAKANHYRIVAIYVDRATTARKDVEKRVHLMEMISDSAKQNWEYVIVWKLDRFARKRNDSAIMKMRLRKNGVKVLSATEHLSDSPESIILESVLEGMAEFFLCRAVTEGHERYA